MQCTEIGNIQSKLEYVKAGVPQGSILGPLLFLLYINDIVLSSDLFKFTLFADDTSLFYSHNNKSDASTIINCELNKISEWLAANKLSLNVGKSKLLIFTNKNKNKKSLDTTIESGIMINGEMLQHVPNGFFKSTLKSMFRRISL